MNREKVLFVHISESLMPWDRKDMEYLRGQYTVRPFFYGGRKDVLRLFASALDVDLVFCSFAWDNAFWGVQCARVRKIPSVVAVSGFDVVNMPEINYGNLIRPNPARRTAWSIRKATKVFAVSNSLKVDAMDASGRDEISVVYHGFDSAAFFPSHQKADQLLTIAAVNGTTLRRKGLSTFARTSKLLPTLPFLLAGSLEDRLAADALRSVGGPNLTLTGELPQNRLIDLLADTRVFVQPSAHEGFGCALAEAMLSECVPVVTDRGAIPEVVGDCGVYVRFDDPEDTVRGIREAFERPELGKRARRRVQEKFPWEKRRDGVLGLAREALEEYRG